MPFKNRVTGRSYNPRADTTLIVEGGHPDWAVFLERDKAEHRAQQERLLAQGRVSQGRFVRRAVRDDGESAGPRITTILGGLPNWRHDDEFMADARREHEAMSAEERRARLGMHDEQQHDCNQLQQHPADDE